MSADVENVIGRLQMLTLRHPRDFFVIDQTVKMLRRFDEEIQRMCKDILALQAVVDALSSRGRS